MCIADSRQLALKMLDCRTRTEAAAEHLVKTFGFVPDDKLAWSPSDTAKPALSIVAHCAMANEMIAKMLSGEAMSPMPAPEDIAALERAFEAAITDRDDAVHRLKASTEAVLAALDAMTEERFATEPISPFGPFPMSFWVGLPAMHMNSHAAQIDYLQTIWGDLDMHM